jgi:hypothetical protein
MIAPNSFGNVLTRLSKINLNSLAFVSTSKWSQKPAAEKTSSESAAPLEWKKNVVVVPVQTTIEDLKKSHRLVKDGFYISHRAWVEKTPEKYTVEPIRTRRTGGRDIETSKICLKGKSGV